MSATLELRSIDQLMAMRFVIPSYQRGYRWTRRQVVDLLDDLYGFQQQAEEMPKDAFYCLQPVVVRPVQDGSWELIDGQQRLTTIYLLLSVLKPMLDMLGRTPFSLSYETRPRSEEFLANPSAELAGENIDFFHIDEAKRVIEEWFAARDGSGAVRFKFASFLLEDEKRNARVIWYEFPPDDDPIEVFVRLNVGRIPLTNAELIRALFLRESNYDQAGHVEQIAHQWDILERQLRNDAFWYFIRGAAPDLATRIEFLLAVHVQTHGATIAHDDPYGIFVAFAGLLSPEETWFDRWRAIKQIAMRLEEWYEDRTLYHLVGTLMHLRTRGTKPVQRPSEVVVELLQSRHELSRSAFERHLRRLIGQHLFQTEVKDPASQVQGLLDDLTYGTHNERLRDVLLLFNVATLLDNIGSNLVFPFSLFQRESWDLEHIRSVTEHRPFRIDDQKRWLARVVEHWADRAPDTSQTVAAEAAEKLLEDFDTKQFDGVYKLVQAAFGEDSDPEESNSVANLTLLDAGTNRSYGNSPFPVKRQRVLHLDKTGTFVPLCTTNAFLKYYSAYDSNSMAWLPVDAEHYATAIRTTLTGFFEAAQ